MLPKIRITSKNASNKSCSELTFIEKSPRAHMSISLSEWSYEARKIGKFEVLLCTETVNYIQLRVSVIMIIFSPWFQKPQFHAIF